MTDARFEDGGESPLRLQGFDSDDLAVISGLCQDAVLSSTDITFRRKDRRLALLLNRFRWEDAPRAKARQRPVERVRSMLVIENALNVQTQGISRNDDSVLSLLSLTYEPDTEAGDRLLLTFAGDGALSIEVEALELVLRDVTRPYRAPSGHIPSHD